MQMRTVHMLIFVSPLPRLPFSFDVPCDYWGRSAVIDPDGRDDERDFGLWYTLDLHVTRLLGENRTDTILVQFPTKDDVKTALNTDAPHWRNLYQRRFFALVCCPVDPGETVLPLQYVLSLSLSLKRAMVLRLPIQTRYRGICPSARSHQSAHHLSLIHDWSTVSKFALFRYIPHTEELSGCSVNFNINLPALPAECQLCEVRGSLQAQFSWTPFSTGKTWSDTPIKYPIFTLTTSTFERDALSGAMSASKAARLPNDRIIGPSSIKGVRSPLTIAHHIVIEFDVIDGTGVRKLVILREAVKVASVSRLIPYFYGLKS